MAASAAPLFSFLALTFAVSWSCWGLSSMVQPASGFAAAALFLLGGFGPAIAAVAVVGQGGGRDGLRDWFRRCLQWRGGWRWALLAFVGPPVLMGLAGLVQVALGGSLPPASATGHGLMVAVNFLLVFLVGGPLGEEPGWRGFALPVLQARVGWRVASLVLGAAWALWHLPLFFMAGTAQGAMPMGLFMASVVASSVLFAWLFNRTGGSVWPVLVLHTGINAWPMLIPVMVLPDGSNLRPFRLGVGILVAVAVALLLRGGPEPAVRRC